MKKNLPDIDHLFKKAIDEHAETPPGFIWDAIEKKLDQNKAADLSRRNARLRKAVIFLLLLLFSAAVYTVKTWDSSNAIGKMIRISDTMAKINDTTSLLRTTSDTTFVNSSKVSNNNASDKRIEKIPPGNLDAEQPGKKISTDFNIYQQGRKSVVDYTSRSMDHNLSPMDSNRIIVKKGNKKITSDEEISILNGDQKGTEEFNKGIGFNSSFINRQIISPELIKVNSILKTPGAGIPDQFTLPDYSRPKFAPGKNRGVKKILPLTLTALVASNFTSNHIGDKDHNRPGSVTDQERDRIKHDENPDASLTYGLLADYGLNKHWTLQSGALISGNTIRMDSKTIYAVADNSGAVKYLYNCASGYAFLSSKLNSSPSVGDSLQSTASTNYLRYITIPLAVKYNYRFNKTVVFASAGASINILTEGKIETFIENATGKEMQSNKLQGLKSTYLGAAIRMGASYNIGRRTAVVLMPSYSFALTPATDGVPVKTYPKAITLAGGLSYAF